MKMAMRNLGRVRRGDFVDCSSRPGQLHHMEAHLVNKTKGIGPFNAQTFLDSAGEGRKIVEFQRKDTIFSQGESSNDVMFIQQGHVKLSVVSSTGKEAIVAMLKPGDFLGEGGLVGQSVRMAKATAAT